MRLSLGTGLDGWRRPALPAATRAPGATRTPPGVISLPTLAGTGRIGAALRVDPGRWSGVPAPALSVQWQRGGADIPGARGATYVPGPADDGLALRAAVTGRNSLGQVTATSAAIAVTEVPPAAKGRLPDLAVMQNSGVHMVNASLDFTGQGLTFGVSGTGVSIDPATGRVAIPSDTLLAGIDVVVTATNSGGTAESRFRLTVAGAEVPAATPPAVIAALADLTLELGRPASVPAAAAFSGTGLDFAVAGAGATVDAAGTIRLPADRLLAGEAVAVTARNAAGTATLVFRIDVAGSAAVAPPAVTGDVLADLPLLQGQGERTVSAQAGFAGTDLTFALAAAPAGVGIETGSGLVRVPLATPLSGTVTVRATNTAGQAERSFAVSVNPTSSDFGVAAALGDMRFLANNSEVPSWTLQGEGHARLVTGATSRVHGLWSRAPGDGRYRCLARWSTATPNAAGARPFSFGGRLGKTKSNWSGIKVDALQTSATSRSLELAQYTGAGTAVTVLGTAAVSWLWNVWHWFELEVDGTLVRARLYPEAAAAPDWQVSGTTSFTSPGGYGPGGFPRFSESPNIDIRRLEFVPLIQGFESVPPAAGDADWSLGQFTESK